MTTEAARVRSVVLALVELREHVQCSRYRHIWFTRSFNRWIDALIGMPLRNARPLRLRWFIIYRENLLAHLDATIAFLTEELAASEDGPGDLVPAVVREDIVQRGWMPRIVKD